MRGPQRCLGMRIRNLLLSMHPVFPVEERADSARITPAHQAVDLGEATPLQQRNDRSPMRVLSGTQNGFAQRTFVCEQGKLFKREGSAARFASRPPRLRLRGRRFVPQIVCFRLIHGDDAFS